MAILKLSEIRNRALSSGLYLVSAAAPPQLGHDSADLVVVERFRQWQAAGFAGEMKYLQREAEIFFRPSHLLPNCSAILSFFVPYYHQDYFLAASLGPAGDLTSPSGRIARYAWGLDYHLTIPQILKRIMLAVIQESTTLSYKIFTDAVPLHERFFAARSRLGFIGKNSLLITYDYGSFGFLAEVLLAELVPGHDLDFDLPTHSHPRLSMIEPERSGDGCGSCNRCQLDCPTAAIVGDGVVDARRCISYLTIEKRGAFSDWESEAIGEWLFGCDICQDVCPFNSALEHQPPEGPSPGPLLKELPLADVLSIRSDAEFRARFRDRPLLRPKREGLLRNAAAVAKNKRVLACLPELIDCVKTDPSAVVRGEALRTLRCFSNLVTGVDATRIQQVLAAPLHGKLRGKIEGAN